MNDQTTEALVKERESRKQQMEQMQALGLRGAEMQRVQQATEQQGLVNRAQQGLGQLMQQHVNPETGDVDINKLLVDAAQHPDAKKAGSKAAKPGAGNAPKGPPLRKAASRGG